MLGANWKTTVMGFLLAVVYYLKTSGVSLPTTKADAYTFIVAVLFAGFGLVAKDLNVTGGTKPNDTTIKA
jgi:hypothetical protein